MTKDSEKAKELFAIYGGNHFFMKKDGVYDDYLKQNVSKDQEVRWGKELTDNLVNKFTEKKLMDEDAHKLFNLLKLFNRITEFKNLVQNVFENESLYDSFTKLLFLESCEGLMEFFTKNKFLSTGDLMNMNHLLLNISNSITSNNISIDSYYKGQTYMAEYLNEEIIYERIKELNIFKKT